MTNISVIIVSWNAKEVLSKCLSALERELKNHQAEVIVVDNASTDGSKEHVREEYPDVQLICNSDNLGFAKANNIGIKRSHGKYIFFINSDAIVKEGCIERMCAYMDQHPEIGMLGPKILNPDSTLQPSCMGLPTLWNVFCRALALDSLFSKSRLFCGRLMNYWPHDAVRHVEVLNGCFWMVRREALEEIGLLDENFFFYGEDVDWCKRYHDSRWEIVFFPEAEAIHYGGVSSANAPVRFYIEMHRADLKYWKKYHSRPLQIGFISTMWIHQIVRIFGQALLYVAKPSRRNQASFKIKRSMACIQWLFGIPFN